MRVSRVGREHVFHIIEGNLSALREGRGSSIFIEGDFGSGKSSVLRGVEELVAGDGNTITISVRGGGTRLREPYQPFREAMEEFEKTLARSIRGVGELLIPRERARHASKFDALQRKIIDYTRLYGVLLLVDDVHDMDTGSVSLLYQLTRLTRKHPLMIVATYRAGEAPPYLTETVIRLQREGITTFFRLEPLTETKTAEFIASLGYVLPDNVCSFIHAQTEGVPYFIVEMLRDMEERGLIDYKKRWSGVSGLDDYSLPSTVEGIVLHRLSALRDVERNVLEYASVIGDEFDFDLIRSLTGLSEDSLIEVLESLVKKRVLREKGTRYAFHHLLMRKVVYNETSKLKRMLIHRKIAYILENSGGSVYEIARHYYHGGNQREALNYLLQAGEGALAEGILKDALWYYQRALEIARAKGETRRVAYISREMGRIYLKLGNYRKALVHLREVAEQAGEEDARLLIDLAKCHLNLGDVDRAMGVFMRASALAGPEDDIDIYSGLGQAYMMKGNYAEAVEHYRKALEIALKTGKDERAIEIYNSIGAMYHSLMDYDNAEDYFRRARDMAEKKGDEVALTESLVNLAAAISRKNVEESVGYLNHALGIAERSGRLDLVATIYMHLSEVLFQEGQVEDAIHYLTLAEEILESLGKMDALRDLYFRLSRVALESGSISLALSNIGKYTEIASYFGDRYSEGVGYLAKAYIYALVGNPDCDEVLDYGVELLSEADIANAEMLMSLYRGNIALVRGDVLLAEVEFSRYIEGAMHGGRQEEAAVGLIRRAICHLAKGDTGAMRADVEHAMKLSVRDFRLHMMLNLLRSLASGDVDGRAEKMINSFREKGLLYYYLEGLILRGMAVYVLGGGDEDLQAAVQRARKLGFGGYEGLYIWVVSGEVAEGQNGGGDE